MPDDIYELMARGARFWFLFLMVIIVWRSLSWYLKDKKTYRKHIRFLPDAGSIGRIEIIRGGELKNIGTSFPVPREGTIGSSRMNDIRMTGEGIQKCHLRFHFEDQIGLVIEKADEKAVASVDGFPIMEQPLCMIHESVLNLCGIEAQLLLFEGFECFGFSKTEDMMSHQQEAEEEATDFSFAPERSNPEIRRRRGRK